MAEIIWENQEKNYKSEKITEKQAKSGNLGKNDNQENVFFEVKIFACGANLEQKKVLLSN